MSLFDNIENKMVTATCKNAANAVSDVMEQDFLVNKLRDAVSASFHKVYSDFNLSMPGMEDLQETLSQSVSAAYNNLIGEAKLGHLLQPSNIADKLFQSAGRPLSGIARMNLPMQNPNVRQKVEEFFLSLKTETLRQLNGSEWDVKLKDVLSGDVVEESKTFIHKGMEQLCDAMEQANAGISSFVKGGGEILQSTVLASVPDTGLEMRDLGSAFANESTFSLLKSEWNKNKDLFQMKGFISSDENQVASAFSRGKSVMDNAMGKAMREGHKRLGSCNVKMTKAHKALIKDIYRMSGRQISAFSKLFK